MCCRDRSEGLLAAVAEGRALRRLALGQHIRFGHGGCVVSDQLAVALLLLPRPAREPLDELALDQLVELALDLVQRLETVQPLRPLLELARRLRAPQHQHAEEPRVVVAEPERLVEEMAVLDGAAPRAAREPHPALAREPLERPADRRLVVLD